MAEYEMTGGMPKLDYLPGSVCESAKKYDLEARTLRFAKDVVRYVRSLKKDMAALEIGKQLVRSAGSIGANYIEANEALSKKDFAMRIKICRKEAKETGYWLQLISDENPSPESRRLKQESTELMKIFGAIVTKTI